MAESLGCRIRCIKAVVFDMDGTLCLPQPWMFPAMRNAIGVNDKSIDILTFIDSLPSALERDEAHRGIEAVEAEAMALMKPQPGLLELMEYLTMKCISKSICTRNLQPPVNYLISKFIPTAFNKFDYILTREFRPTKPNPDPILYIAKQLSLHPKEVVMVGDSYDDMKSGRHAGCITILLKNHVNGYLLDKHADLIDITVDDLADIVAIFKQRNPKSTYAEIK